jgi:hypothetical protein
MVSMYKLWKLENKLYYGERLTDAERQQLHTLSVMLHQYDE